MAVVDFIEGWYYPHSCHSDLGQKAQLNFEGDHPLGARNPRRFPVHRRGGKSGSSLLWMGSGGEQPSRRGRLRG